MADRLRASADPLVSRDEATFESLFAESPLPMWVVDARTQHFLAVNRAAIRHYGYSEQQFLAMFTEDMFTAEDRDEFRRFLAEGPLGQGTRTFHHRKADGSRCSVLIYGNAIRYKDCAARINVVVDVTAREAVEDRLLSSKQHLDAAISNMSQGLVLFDADDKLVLCNQKYLQMYDLAADVVRPGTSLTELIQHRMIAGGDQSDPTDYERELLSNIRSGATYSRTNTLPDGRSIHIVIQAIPGIGGWVVTHEDVTDRLSVEAKLRQKTSQLKAALQHLSQGLCMFDANGCVVLFNERYSQMMGLPSAAIQGRSLLDLFKIRKEMGEFTGDPEQFFAQLLAQARSGISDVKIVRGPKGCILRIADQPMPEGGWVATYEDITEWHEAQTKVEYLAHHDPLTDLANRIAFSRFLEIAIANASESAQELGVLSLDLDRFKEINDVFGHPAGDSLLREVAKRLKQALPECFVARLGGDEFCMVVPGNEQPKACEDAAHRINEAFAPEFDLGITRVKSGVSDLTWVSWTNF